MEIGLSILAVIVAFVAVAGALYFSRRGKRSEAQANRQIPWRKNVLVCLGTAYVAIIGLFLVMALAGDGVTTEVGTGAAKITTTTSAAMEAYQLISVPFVALIGATVAIAKDLLDPP